MKEKHVIRLCALCYWSRMMRREREWPSLIIGCGMHLRYCTACVVSGLKSNAWRKLHTMTEESLFERSDDYWWTRSIDSCRGFWFAILVNCFVNRHQRDVSLGSSTSIAFFLLVDRSCRCNEIGFSNWSWLLCSQYSVHLRRSFLSCSKWRKENGFVIVLFLPEWLVSAEKIRLWSVGLFSVRQLTHDCFLQSRKLSVSKRSSYSDQKWSLSSCQINLFLNGTRRYDTQLSLTSVLAFSKTSFFRPIRFLSRSVCAPSCNATHSYACSYSFSTLSSALCLRYACIRLFHTARYLFCSVFLSFFSLSLSASANVGHTYTQSTFEGDAWQSLLCCSGVLIIQYVVFLSSLYTGLSSTRLFFLNRFCSKVLRHVTCYCCGVFWRSYCIYSFVDDPSTLLSYRLHDKSIFVIIVVVHIIWDQRLWNQNRSQRWPSLSLEKAAYSIPTDASWYISFVKFQWTEL